MKQRLVHGLAWGTALAFGVACSTTLTEERVTRNLWIRSDTPGVDVAVRDGDKVLSQGPAPLHFQDERTRRTETFDETNWIWATAPGFALIVMGAATRTNEGGSTGDSKSGGGAVLKNMGSDLLVFAGILTLVTGVVVTAGVSSRYPKVNWSDRPHNLVVTGILRDTWEVRIIPAETDLQALDLHFGPWPADDATRSPVIRPTPANRSD